MFFLVKAVFIYHSYKIEKKMFLNIDTVGKNENYPIDLVYLWCQDNPQRKKIRNELMEKLGILRNSNTNTLQQTTKARFVSSDELKYSLRSVEKYAQWINKIYIVTDNQIPEWLNLNHPKIKIVDHKEIMPINARPNFNAFTIEHYIVNIKGLSEHFLYANDDMMFSNEVVPGDFFKDGKPIYIFAGKITKTNDNYSIVLARSYVEMKKKFGFYYKNLIRFPHHNIDPYTRTNILNCQKEFKQEFKETMNSKFRSNLDIFRNIYHLYGIFKEDAYYKIQRKKYISAYFDMHNFSFKSLEHIKNRKMFCVNDNEITTDLDRDNYVAIMETLFPKKSSFEK